VRPSNTALHQPYSNFYVQAVAGTTTSYFGPYELKVGCYIGVVTYADHTSLASTGSTRNVGDSVSNVYTFTNPTSTIAWCTVQSNEVVEIDGSTPSTTMDNCASQVCS
jgi:hypothetical protein